MEGSQPAVYFEFSIENIKEYNVALLSLKDKRTGFVAHTTIPNALIQTAATQAYLLARFSRCPLGTVKIFREVIAKQSSAEERMKTIVGYGHASVAEGAWTFVSIDNIQDIYAPLLFSMASFGAGQHGSTRYIDFGGLQPVDLSSFLFSHEKIECQNLSGFNDVNTKLSQFQLDLNEKFNHYKKVIYEFYISHFGVDTSNKKHLAAVEARTLDTARAFLPKGLWHITSFCWITNAREWATIISFFKSRSNPFERYLGEQIELLLTIKGLRIGDFDYVPEAGDIVKYTEPKHILNDSIHNISSLLKEKEVSKCLESLSIHSQSLVKQSVRLLPNKYSGAQKAVAQTIQLLYPRVPLEDVLELLQTLDDDILTSVGNAVFGGYDCYNQMGISHGTKDYTFVLNLAHSEMRDFARHRAWVRWTPQVFAELDYNNFHQTGYIIPLYLDFIPEMKYIRASFVSDLQYVYEQISNMCTEFSQIDWFPQHLLPQLNTFAHNVEMIFHGSPRDISYMTDRRVRPGGHINYRCISQEMAYQASTSEPICSGLILKHDVPDPCSKEQFLDRS